MIKAVPKEIREELIKKAKKGIPVKKIAKQYGYSDRTVYKWIKPSSDKEISIIEYNKLKRENEELKRIIGLVTLELERKKKDKNN